MSCLGLRKHQAATHLIPPPPTHLPATLLSQCESAHVGQHLPGWQSCHVGPKQGVTPALYIDVYRCMMYTDVCCTGRCCPGRWDPSVPTGWFPPAQLGQSTPFTRFAGRTTGGRARCDASSSSWEFCRSDITTGLTCYASCTHQGQWLGSAGHSRTSGTPDTASKRPAAPFLPSAPASSHHPSHGACCPRGSASAAARRLVRSQGRPISPHTDAAEGQVAQGEQRSWQGLNRQRA